MVGWSPSSRPAGDRRARRPARTELRVEQGAVSSDLTVDLPELPALGRTRVLGVLNVTPDSFSDGGLFADTDTAVRHGLALAASGADIVDVGGESTRPGAQRVAEDEELRRVQPVVARLAREGVRVSIDTTRGSVARAALDAGARLVNDVSGGADPLLVDLVAASGVAYVLMHMRGTSADMSSRARLPRRGGRGRRGAGEAGRCGRRARRAQRAGACRPRHRLRQERRPQLAAAGPPRPAAGRRTAAARGAQPQVVPRCAAGRPGRAAAGGRRPRRRHPGPHRDRGGAGRVGRAGACRPPRGRRCARCGRAAAGAGDERAASPVPAPPKSRPSRR